MPTQKQHFSDRTLILFRVQTTFFLQEVFALINDDNAEFNLRVCLFVCLLGDLFSSGFNPSCIFALYSLEGS